MICSEIPIGASDGKLCSALRSRDNGPELRRWRLSEATTDYRTIGPVEALIECAKFLLKEVICEINHEERLTCEK